MKDLAPYLPTVNAILNATAFLLLLTGFVLVKFRRLDAHRNVMLSACAVSALFLASYLLYHYLIGGGKPFQAQGWVRPLYFTMLISHILGAVSLVFLVPPTLWRAYKKRFADHRRLARITLPIWLYVSVTGVLTYIFLYILYP